MADDNYSILTDGELRGLTEAHASGVEVISYMALTRYHNDPEHPARCWKSAQIAEAETGIGSDVFRKALMALTRKTFVHEGKDVPVLTKISRGHNGRSAVYNDNLYAARVLQDKSQVAGTIQPAKFSTKRPSSRNNHSTNYDENKKVAGTKRPSSRNNHSTQIKELKAGDAAPPAQRSVAVSQPHKQESTSERLQVATGPDPARAPACAAHGRTAAALPTFAEVLGKPSPQEAAPFTEADERRYHELLRKVEDHMALGGDYSDALEPEERSEFQEISARRRGSLHE